MRSPSFCYCCCRDCNDLWAMLLLSNQYGMMSWKWCWKIEYAISLAVEMLVVLLIINIITTLCTNLSKQKDSCKDWKCGYWSGHEVVLEQRTLWVKKNNKTAEATIKPERFINKNRRFNAMITIRNMVAKTAQWPTRTFSCWKSGDC